MKMIVDVLESYGNGISATIYADTAIKHVVFHIINNGRISKVGAYIKLDDCERFANELIGMVKLHKKNLTETKP